MPYQRRSGYKNQDEVPQQEDTTARDKDNNARDNSRSRSSQKEQRQDKEFVSITGLFETQKQNGTYTIFLNPEILEVLSTIEEGDLLGISPNKKHENMYNLWVMKKG